MPLRLSDLGARQQESDIARLMTMALERPELLSLAAGFTDTRTLPLSEVSQLATELGEAGDRSILQYGSNQGRPDLRTLLTARLAGEDGNAAATSAAPELSTASALITNGSQQALYLAVQTLCDAGDAILVEQPTYFVFLELLRGLGVEAIPMPMRGNGEVDVAGVRQLLSERKAAGKLDRVKALYVVSYFANPSGHSISSASKKELVTLLAEYGGAIALLEDAAYRELYYSEPHTAPSAIGLAQEAGVPICFTTTMTKPFASGLKVGYAYCSDQAWLGSMLAVKGQQDFGSAHYPQAIAARALAEGLFDRHLEKLRASYQRKMDKLDAELREPLSELGWEWKRPRGGLYLWLQAPDGIETGFDSAFHAQCLDKGVMYVPGALCYPEGGPKDRIRLSFGVLDLEQLKEAGRRFVEAAKCVVEASA